MTTNPTPLTAETLAKDLVAIYNPVAGSQDLGVPYIATRIEAYAAQQNAEMVAWITDSEKKIMEKLKENDHLQAENERLKQQLAWQPISTAPKDGWCKTFQPPEEPTNAR